jgi:hypothetical protein
MTLPPSGTLPTSREGGRTAIFKLLALFCAWHHYQFIRVFLKSKRKHRFLHMKLKGLKPYLLPYTMTPLPRVAITGMITPFLLG